MKIKNGDLYVCKDPLQNLLRISMPAKYGFPLAKTAKKLLEEIKLVEDSVNGLIVKYGSKDEKGNTSIDEKHENWAKFGRDYNELMDLDNEITIRKVQIPSDIDVMTTDLIKLEPFIEVVDG